MKDIEHASINGVEIHNLAEQDDDENLLYSGELWMDGKKIGSFREGENDVMLLDVSPEYRDRLNEKIESYLRVLSESDEDGSEEEKEDLSNEIFLEDLIELELYLQAYREGVAEGYNCLLVNYTKEGVDVFSVESADDVEDVVRENNLTDFQTFYEPEHFIINC
jgi:hypothetical protein